MPIFEAAVAKVQQGNERLLNTEEKRTLLSFRKDPHRFVLAYYTTVLHYCIYLQFINTLVLTPSLYLFVVINTYLLINAH